MKTKPKRLWAVLLTLCLALSIMPLTAFAGVTDVTGDNTTNTYSHFYHTKVETTAQVTIKDADGNVIETTEVTKSGDFVEGNVSSDAVQVEIKRIDDEIIAQFSSRGNITTENRNSTMVFDHFESSNIIAPDGDILVGDQDALENAASGSVNKNLVVHEYQVYQTTYDLIVQAIDGGSQDEATINNAYIENVKFAYRSGDAPQATAEVLVDPSLEEYEIAYECLEEMENGEPVAFWYSDESKYTPSMKKITQFEEGKTYMYSIELREKNGYTFADNCSVTINGNPISATANVVKTVEGLFVMNVETIRPQATKEISVIEINNATLTFKDGDKPVFTGTVPENDQYAFRCEWWSLDENTGIVSTEPEWGGDIYTNKITAFEAGKTYHYGVYVTAYTADISPDAKLKINGQEVEYTRIGDESDTQSFWVETELTMTPTSDPAKKEIPVVEINNATLTFKDGDKPVFTGTTPDDAPYVLVFEEWRTDGEWTRSDEWFNNADHHGNDKDITAFDKNKSYNYTLYIKTNSKGAEEGWYFGQNTKLKINKKEVSFTRDVSDSEYHFSGTTGITMTPTADGHTHSYGKAWIYDSANHWHECSCGDKSDTAAHTFKWVTDKEATATEKGSKHEECTVCGYKKAAVEIPVTGSATQPTDSTKPVENKPGNTTSPKTGDTSNMLLWFALLFVSGGAAIATTVVSRKKKYNR